MIFGLLKCRSIEKSKAKYNHTLNIKLLMNIYL